MVAMFSYYSLPFMVFTSTLVLHLPIHQCRNALGSHSEPSAGATTLGGKFPPAGVFYFHFVKPGQPLIMRGVIQETYPDFSKWTDEYIRRHYGNETVSVELGKKEDRPRSPNSQLLSTFLDTYSDSDMYMVHSVPHSMKDEIPVPPSLQCGGFQQSIQDAVIWFSSGNTRSVLHYDALDNLICLFDGEKKFVLFDKKYNSVIEEDGFVKEGSYSLVDVDDVDGDSFPGVAKTPWNRVSLKAGDCLFVPHKWFHHVYSTPGRNLAVNFWFSHLWWFNRADCVDADTSVPLSAFNIDPHYEQMRSEFLSVFADQDEVSREEFNQRSKCETTKQTWKFWRFINSDRDASVLSWPELYSFNMAEAVAQFRQCLVGSFYMFAEDADDDVIDDATDDDVVVDFVSDAEEELDEKVLGRTDKATEEDFPNETQVEDDTATKVEDVNEHEERLADMGDTVLTDTDEGINVQSMDDIPNDQNTKDDVDKKNVDHSHTRKDKKADKVIHSDDKFKEKRRKSDDPTHTHDEF